MKPNAGHIWYFILVSMFREESKRNIGIKRNIIPGSILKTKVVVI